MQTPASGFSNFIYAMPDGNVRRVPRTPEAREACLRQCRFLPRLASRLPVRIPVPLRCDREGMVYRKLAGEPLRPDMPPRWNAVQIADDVAAFMRELHSIPVQDALSWGVPATNRTAQLLAAADRVLPLIPSEWQKPALAWREQFIEMPHPDVPIHGDLWHENILIDPQNVRVLGVLDFDEASIGDPAWDLATQLHCGREFAELVFEAYPFKDASMWARTEALFRLRPFEGLDWAVKYKDTAEFEDGLRKLQEVGVLPEAGMIRTMTAPWLGTVAE
jgi:aminoglycoside phosphotransferase (APT) family kinase protein